LFGVVYYGFSYIPDLIPINTFVPIDTVDKRQQDHTHSTISVASDSWHISDQKQLTVSAFFRSYNLNLHSNFEPDFTHSLIFPNGLIAQSGVRTVAGGGLVYSQKIRKWFSVLAGIDLRRVAPRDLHRINSQGDLQAVTSNNLTLSFVEPYFAVHGTLSRYFHYDLGVRRENVWVNHQDVFSAQNSFDRFAGLTLPKALSQSCRLTMFFFPALHLATEKRSIRKTLALAPGLRRPRCWHLPARTNWWSTKMYGITISRSFSNM
jgi:hypothetical protein